MENDFHDVVNQDHAMDDEISSVPEDSDNMIGSIIGIVQEACLRSVVASKGDCARIGIWPVTLDSI